MGEMVKSSQNAYKSASEATEYKLERIICQNLTFSHKNGVFVYFGSAIKKKIVAFYGWSGEGKIVLFLMMFNKSHSCTL